MSYLSILGGVFLLGHFCKVPLLSMALRDAFSAGCYFCLMYLMMLFCFFIACYGHKEHSLGSSNCNYLPFYQKFELVRKHMK